MKANELSDLLEEYELEPKSNKELRIQSIEQFLETNDIEVKEDWKIINFNELKDYIPIIVRYEVYDYINPDNLIFKIIRLKFSDILYKKDINGKKILKDSNLQKIIDDIEDTINKILQDLLPIARKINPSIEQINLDADIDLSNGLKSTPHNYNRRKWCTIVFK